MSHSYPLTSIVYVYLPVKSLPFFFRICYISLTLKDPHFTRQPHETTVEFFYFASERKPLYAFYNSSWFPGFSLLFLEQHECSLQCLTVHLLNVSVLEVWFIN